MTDTTRTRNHNSPLAVGAAADRIWRRRSSRKDRLDAALYAARAAFDAGEVAYEERTFQRSFDEAATRLLVETLVVRV